MQCLTLLRQCIEKSKCILPPSLDKLVIDSFQNLFGRVGFGNAGDVKDVIANGIIYNHDVNDKPTNVIDEDDIQSTFEKLFRSRPLLPSSLTSSLLSSSSSAAGGSSSSTIFTGVEGI